MTRSMMIAVAMVFMTACSLLPFRWGTARPENELSSPSPMPTDPPDAGGAASVRLEFEAVQYDGQDLSGRFLVGAVGGRLLLDRRLVENVSLVVRSVADCATGQEVEFLAFDFFPSPPSDQKLMILNDGFWYGADVRFPLFDPKLNGKTGPDCIDVVLSFHLPASAAGEHGDARITVHSPRVPERGPGAP
jgi:hypothetical protein